MRTRPLAGLVAGTLGAAVLTAVPLAGPASAAPVEIQIITTNDFHGRLEPARGGVGGAAFVAGAVDALKAQNPNTLFASAGDNIGATPFISSVQQDAPTIEALDAVPLDVSAVGNHEFDRGYADLAGRVQDLAGFPYLGANVEGESPDLDRSFVTTVGGVRVGFIGVVTEQTASLVSPDGIAGITFTDPVTAANAEASRLTAAGLVDVVVLLAHEGAATSATTPEACAALPERQDAFGEVLRGVNGDIDAVVAGHTHVEVACQLSHPALAGRVLPVVEAGEYGANVGRLRLTVDSATGAVGVVGTEVVDVTSTAFTADPEVQAIVDAAKARADEVGREVVGRITADVRRAVTASGSEDRGGESALGNLIADVQLAATREPRLGGAQIAFMNPGGLRADLLFAGSEGGGADGEVTFAELAEVQPFANGLITMTLTGAQVEQVLEEQFQPAGASRPYLQLGVSRGFAFTADASRPAGDRITSATLDGQPLVATQEYRVTVNSFLASGGDDFDTLTEGTARQDNGFNDLNVLVDFFRANSPVSPPATDRATVTGTIAPSPTASPVPPSPTATPTASPVADGTCVFGGSAWELSETTATVGEAVQLRVTDAADGAIVRVYAYTRPSTEYRLVREGIGRRTFTFGTPQNTRFYVTGTTCETGPENSQALGVRSGVSINAARLSPRTYAFSGRVLPSRTGQLVSLYRVEADGDEVLTAQTRVGADGVWRLQRRFLGSGEFGFVARTGTDLVNLAGASRVRPTVIH